MPTASRHATLQKTTPNHTRSRPRLLPLFATAWMLVTVLPAASAQPADNTSQRAQQSQQALENDKIDYLIASVATLKNASFIRNGQAYDASRAASHMHLKWRFAGSRVKTAEDFIRYCATASSTSGTPYTIRFADGHTVPSATFLQKKLAEYGSMQAPAAGLQHTQR